jgi:ABC-type transport system substrate-binding protein
MNKFRSKHLVLSFVAVAAFGSLFSCSNRGKGAAENTIRIPIIADAKTFDPQMVDELYSNYATSMVYEGLLEYEYLKRPHQMKGLLAESLPEVSKDELTYTFKIKKGVKFIDSPVFEGGKGRELTANDVLYSFLRVADPKVNSPGFWIFDGHIEGLNEWREKQKTATTVDYANPPTGFKVVDSHTFQIKLKRKYPQLLFVLAMPQTFVVAREAVEKLGADFQNKPVGTGPYVLTTWLRNSKIVFDRSPSWRGEPYPSEGEASDKAIGLLEDAGKMMPFIDRVEYLVFVEDSTQWLKFKSGELDYSGVPKDNYAEAINKDTKDLTDIFKKQNVRLDKEAEPDVTYIAFNMDDPVIKKLGPNFRKAVSLVLDKDKSVDLFSNGRAIVAQSPIPPGLAGYDAEFVNPYAKRDLERAKEFLAKAGYPGGKGLPRLSYESTQGTTSRQSAQKVQAELLEIGINIDVNVNQFSELTQKINERKAQMWGIAWIADYPDVENFLQLLYGKNKAPAPNGSNFDDPEYNKLFEQVRSMADSPERRKLIRRMQDIFVENLPWIPERHRIRYTLIRPWTKNAKLGYYGGSIAKFLRVDSERRSQGL